jgi:hypothetical protein
MGATISTLVSYALFCVLRYWASNLFFKVRYEWGRVFMVLGFGALLTAAFYVSDSLRGESPSRSRVFMSMAIKVSLALSFPLLLFVFRFFDPRELRRINEAWQKVGLFLKQRRLLRAGSES